MKNHFFQVCRNLSFRFHVYSCEFEIFPLMRKKDIKNIASQNIIFEQEKMVNSVFTILEVYVLFRNVIRLRSSVANCPVTKFSVLKCLVVCSQFQKNSDENRWIFSPVFISFKIPVEHTAQIVFGRMFFDTYMGHFY